MAVSVPQFGELRVKIIACSGRNNNNNKIIIIIIIACVFRFTSRVSRKDGWSTALSFWPNKFLIILCLPRHSLVKLYFNFKFIYFTLIF